MPTPQREPLRRLSRAERAALERIACSLSERADYVRRATALLAVARTGVFIQAAREAGLHSGTTVADLVARFNRVGLAAVRIAPGRGRKSVYPLSARAQIVATAQGEPDRRTDGTATWSLSTLQRALRRAGLPRVGTSTIRRVLQQAGSSYQRTRTWCPTGTAQRKRKSGVVTVVDPKTEEKRNLIDQAYRIAEAMGIPLWCQDEAGPYQAIPQPGQSWQPVSKPRRQPHEYLRGGTAKLLTLFRPATGEVRAKGVPRAPNAVLHPWLKQELLQVLEELPEVASHHPERPPAADWATWLGHVPHLPLPPLRLILIWDNLAGHLSTSIVTWLFAHGVMPLYTPLSGSWLNMAESLQRIICGRALNGQHPQTVGQLITWLEDAVLGWNANPTPFEWDGKRRARRIRAKQRRLLRSTAATTPQLIAA
jgi:transposase